MILALTIYLHEDLTPMLLKICLQFFVKEEDIIGNYLFNISMLNMLVNKYIICFYFVIVILLQERSEQLSVCILSLT